MNGQAVDFTTKVWTMFAAGAFLGGMAMLVTCVWFFCFSVPPAQIRAELVDMHSRRRDRRVARRG